MPINERPGPDEPPHRRRDHPTPATGLSGPAELPHADRPSIRVAMAAVMLRHGRDPLHVADTTGVPLALVELLAEHLPTPAPAHPDNPVTTSPRPPRPAPFSPHPPPLARSWAWWLLTAFLPILTNLGLAVTAVAAHRPALAAVSLIAVAPMFVVTVLLARH